MRPFWCVPVVLALGLAGCASSFPEQAERRSVIVDRDVSVAMRDGVVLRADVVRPTSDGRHPTLVHRTPYGKSSTTSGEFVGTAVARGYVVVVQDVRGRYASDGEFAAYTHEGQDGFDTIEWAAVQPWSNGRVGTFGLSYPGAVQWLAAVESPPHLVAMAPAMTFASPTHFWYTGGVWDGSWCPALVRARQRGPGRRRPLALSTDRGVVTFETAPLTEDVEVLGPIDAEIYVSVDRPDTDLWVKLLDVEPDGTAWGIMSIGLDVLRASYRNRRAARQLLEPGEVYRLSLSTLMTGNRFLAGHRIRVAVMASFAPNMSWNLHTGGLEFDSSATATATVTVHAGGRHPSKLVLPVTAAAPLAQQ